MPRPVRWLVLTLVTGCSARVAEPSEDRPEPPPVAATSEAMHEFDPSEWNGRCVIAQGYAQEQKIGPLLDLGGPSIGVIFEGDGRWSVPLGARVEVRGWIAERSDLPVFIPDPDEPIMQGMPVPPGTDLEQARKRFVIERAEVTLLRSVAEVEAALMGRIGERVELEGVLWSRNDAWWFAHDGVDLHLERESPLAFEDHGRAVTVHGQLARKPKPRIELLGISDGRELVDSFVIRVRAIEPHPGWPLRGCEEG